VGLRASDFYRETNSWVYSAAMSLADRYQTVDTLTVGDVLEQRTNGEGTQLDALGGTAEFAKLINATPSSIHIKHYAEIVVRTARQRRLIAVAGEIAQMAHKHDGTVEALYDAAAKTFFGAVDVSGPGSHLYGTDEALMNYLVVQEERAEALRRDPNALIKTGIPGLDWLLGDMPGGYLHAIVARSSVGKTMYAEQVAEYNAKRGHPVAFYHLELSHQMMQDRRMARFSGIAINDLRRGHKGPEIGRALDDIRAWQERIVYVHCPGWSAERIAADIARLYARGECDLAVVDYLQKIRLPQSKGMNSAMLIGQQAETLKTCAESLDIPIVLGSQVSRGYKNNQDKRPTMADIRNSGELEEKSNQIVVLHRPVAVEDRPRGATKEIVEARVEKNTTGATGKVELVHILGRFILGEASAVEVDPDPLF